MRSASSASSACATGSTPTARSPSSAAPRCAAGSTTERSRPGGDVPPPPGTPRDSVPEWVRGLGVSRGRSCPCMTDNAPAARRSGSMWAMDQRAVRIDKWLWAARLVKTRALAVDAIRGGRVKVNGAPAKPSKDVKPGDELEFSAGVIPLTAVIKATAERRLPAAEAVRLYEETEDSRVERERRVAEMKMTRPQGVERNARPTKRERRRLDQLKGRSRR